MKYENFRVYYLIASRLQEAGVPGRLMPAAVAATALSFPGYVRLVASMHNMNVDEDDVLRYLRKHLPHPIPMGNLRTEGEFPSHTWRFGDSGGRPLLIEDERGRLWRRWNGGYYCQTL
ncbi:MAG: hypothetical protein N2595_05860 [bacterium]|nr:hypothetical protein [bacterium]